MVKPRIGVLALQGDFAAHLAALAAAGVEAVDVRRPAQLPELSGVILPGGESSTLLNLMADAPWFETLRGFHAAGGAIFGTCAGAILLAREVVEPAQASLGLLDAVVARNAFGRQVDSFETRLEVVNWTDPLEAVFIRAPRFRKIGPRVEVLARLGQEPVLVREGSLLAGTFHPELTGDTRLHRLFIEMASGTDQIRQANRPRAAINAGRV